MRECLPGGPSRWLRGCAPEATPHRCIWRRRTGGNLKWRSIRRVRCRKPCTALAHPTQPQQRTCPRHGQHSWPGRRWRRRQPWLVPRARPRPRRRLVGQLARRQQDCADRDRDRGRGVARRRPARGWQGQRRVPTGPGRAQADATRLGVTAGLGRARRDARLPKVRGGPANDWLACQHDPGSSLGPC